MAPLLEIEHIMDALKGFVRPLREGREAMKNLIIVGVRKRSAEEVHVEALCVRTTKIHEEPVKIDVFIDLVTTEVEKRVKDIGCSCPAGASKEHCCKHALATLLYLERHDEEELETLTCTDVEQWGEMKEKTLSQFDPIPIMEFCHIGAPLTPYKRLVLDVTKELDTMFQNMYLAAQPKSECAVFLSCSRFNEAHTVDQATILMPLIPMVVSHALTNASYVLQRTSELGKELYLECTQAEREFFDKFVKISEQNALDFCLQTQDQSGEEWEKRRYGRITGSVCYSLYTYSRNKAPNWDKKLKSIYESTFKGNKDTERGLMYEGDAKDCYEKKMPHNKIIHPGIIISPAAPWLGYSADGIICDQKKVVRLWECKTPASGKKHGAPTICSALTYMNKKCEGKLKEKHHYFGQVQLGMLLTSLPICDFTIYCYKFDEVFVDPVPFNEKFCLEMTEALSKVYFKQILPWLCKRASVSQPN